MTAHLAARFALVILPSYHHVTLEMGKRYYCDYCDKAFADNASSRKNHLKGVSHQRMKRHHYASFQGKCCMAY